MAKKRKQPRVLSPAGPTDQQLKDEVLVRLFDSCSKRDNAEQRIAVLVAVARERGLSWDRIGAVVGITGYGASKRYGNPGVKR